jgi:hypothetical protein
VTRTFGPLKMFFVDAGFSLLVLLLEDGQPKDPSLKRRQGQPWNLNLQ